MAVSFIKVVLPAFFGASSAIVGGLHLGTVETFESYLKKHCIPKEIDFGDKSPWKKAEEKIKKDDVSSNITNLYSPFKDLKRKITSDNSSNGKILKNTCVEAYSWIYNSFIVNNKKLLPVIKEYCYINIESMLKSDKKYSNKNDIGSIEDKISKPKLTSTLTFEFNRIKEKTDKSKEIENFYKECERLYKSAYLGEEDNDWKVVQDYCTK